RAPGRVYRQVPNAELCCARDSAPHRLRDVVKLQIQEDIEPDRATDLDGPGPFAREQLEADLQHTDGRRDAAHDGLRRVDVGVVDGEDEPAARIVQIAAA